VGIQLVENNAFSHGGNTGSSPVGSAKDFKDLGSASPNQPAGVRQSYLPELMITIDWNRRSRCTGNRNHGALEFAIIMIIMGRNAQTGWALIPGGWRAKPAFRMPCAKHRNYIGALSGSGLEFAPKPDIAPADYLIPHDN
jgi:hypothetical protein